jgi:3-methyladenine DNA glycosylase AlkD
MTLSAPALAKTFDTRLRAVADPARAVDMAAYMKNVQRFVGVPSPARAALFRELRRDFVPTTPREYDAGVRALWRLPYREGRYVALLFAEAHKKFVTRDALALYEQMIREGAWWDVVDELAADLVGLVWARERAALDPILDRWIDDDHLWIRRTALLAQLRHKQDTDEPRLYRYCLQRAAETDFFIRKAIGWALREHAKTAPRSVARFLKEHKAKLSGLSYREAAKHLTS